MTGPILVATGYASRSSVSDAYVVKTDNPADQPCNLPPYPFKMSRGTGAVINEKMIICGGLLTPRFDPALGLYVQEETPSCYFFDPKLYSWQLLANMSSARYWHSSAPFNGGLWVTGGRAPPPANVGGRFITLDTTEIVYPNGSVIEGPKLPFQLKNHCMVTLTDGRIMFIGGSGHYLGEKR